MKLFVVVAALVAVCLAKPNLHRQENKLVDYITRYGYPAESRTVTTADGYILQLVRIPHGVVKSQSQVKDNQRTPVLLFHGFGSTAEDFVYGGPSQGLAFFLADHGYDVYLGNARGSVYGQQHTSLDPTRDAIFWRYCFDDIGKKDLPAIIDQVLSVTQQEKLIYIGHAEGATAFLILAAEHPEYVEKVERAVTLGPIAYMKKSVHPVLSQIVSNHKSISWIMRNVGTSLFNPSNNLISTVQNQCNDAQPKEHQQICQNVYFLFNGYNSQHLNQTTVREVIQRVPLGGSIREVLHYAQLTDSGRFESFAYDPTKKNLTSHEYNLANVRVPIAVFYTSHDLLSTVEDVETLISKIPNVYHQKQYTSYTNNLDLLYGNNVVSVYEDIVDLLVKQQRKQKIGQRE